MVFGLRLGDRKHKTRWKNSLDKNHIRPKITGDLDQSASQLCFLFSDQETRWQTAEHFQKIQSLPSEDNPQERFFVPLKNFSLIWRHHHYRWSSAHVDQCSALMAIEQWGCVSVSHLLWHGTSVYNGHLRGPATLAPVTERLAVELLVSRT